ncbi:hypothetical protein LINPERHAP1_LOCUS36563 [Linum perenne]
MSTTFTTTSKESSLFSSISCFLEKPSRGSFRSKRFNTFCFDEEYEKGGGGRGGRGDKEEGR